MCIYNAQSYAEKVQSILHKIGHGHNDSHAIFKKKKKMHEGVYIYINNFSSKSSGFQLNINNFMPKNNFLQNVYYCKYTILTFPERGLQRNFIYIKDTIIQRQI